MPLVDYESDDETELPVVAASKKRKLSASKENTSLPSLPEQFLDLYATSARSGVKDDPSLHEGRSRAIPHIEGNWPSHIYIEWRPNPRATEALESIIVQAAENSESCADKIDIKSSLKSPLGADAPLHISLSRSLGLRSEQMEPFTGRLEAALRGENSEPFQATADDLKWVSNYEGNRWFLVLQMAPMPDKEFQKLLDVCNKVAKEFNQPSLYESASNSASMSAKKARPGPSTSSGQAKLAPDERENPFHVSIAWTLQKPDDELSERASQVWASSQTNIVVPVSSIKVKTGNIVHSIPLKGKNASFKGVVG